MSTAYKVFLLPDEQKGCIRGPISFRLLFDYKSEKWYTSKRLQAFFGGIVWVCEIYF